jgi:RecA-family ATPase
MKETAISDATNKTKTGNARTELRQRSLGELLNDDIPKREPLLGSWLTNYHLGMIYAPSGCGKSFFAMSVGLAVAGAGEYLDWRADKDRKVLIIDGEMDTIDLKERAETLMTAMPSLDQEAVKTNFSVVAFQDQKPGTKWPDLADPDCHQTILNLVDQGHVDLLILDNFSTLAAVADENSAASMDEVVDLMRTLKRAGTTVLLVHHSRKNSGGPGSWRGSQKLSVTMQSIIRLSHPNGLPSTDGAAFDVEFEKIRAMRTDETIGRSVKLNGEAWTWERSEATQAHKVSVMIQSREYVNQTAVAEALGVARSTVSKRLNKAYTNGIITRNEVEECFRNAAEYAKERADETEDIAVSESDDF